MLTEWLIASTLLYMNTKSTRALYSFNFLPEGFNAVWADSKDEAIAKAKAEFPSLAHQIDEKSFVRRAS